MESFDLQSYRDFLIDMDPVKFIMEYTNITDRDKIVKAIESEAYLESLYFEYPNIFNSYLGFQTFLRETKRIITDFFSFANELRTEAFLQAVSNVQSTVNHERKKCIDSLSNLEPLEFSQKIMGKTFRNRGPYTTFYFMPSLFTPYKAIRFFENDQFLFYSIRKEKLEDEQMLKQLKTIADETRLKIISLLNQKEPLRGMDIGKELSLAQSTVSHHMEQLKNAGLLHEEQVKNSKYYSLSRNSIDELLQLLTETLGKK
ncbi:MAG TPA: metalloregulator ArsR/SmtB family transcription factor [Lachnospiraceae bacterium]|nr:metalloregulator ArsR/SmtB family transcription factor [Lachnospiraceae bacterium]